MRRLLLLILFLALPLHAGRVTLLHFSDYHSHALPFYTDEGERGGIARAIGYLAQAKKEGALVFSGGDMINKGAPAWSDRYGCTEWAWLNGIVDAMAFGNHDPDYGAAAFTTCRSSTRYPILGANVTPAAGPLRPYAVLKKDGMRIGVFAVAGSDFPQLVKVPGFTFTDPVEAARNTVSTLRGKEHVDAVVMIGHEHAEADYQLAAAVPGIDLIFGSHSHLERELTQIPGTSTWYISPWQYLSYISRVELTVEKHKVTGVRGALVPVDKRLPADPAIALKVAAMQTSLEHDPRFRERFVPIGRLDAPLSVEHVALRTLETMRAVTGAAAALSTVSSFRAPLPAGVLTRELLLGALPYDNEIIVCTMTGAQLQRVLDFSASRKGSDSESFISIASAVDPAGSYKVATTDFLANVAYRDVFTCDQSKSGLHVREELEKALTK